MSSIKTYEGFFDFFKKKNPIDSICKKWGIENYTINEDGTIDVDGTVNLCWYKVTDYRSALGELAEIPLKFRNVTGDFYCQNSKLTSLEGCPQTVGGDFACENNRLSSLEGCPQSVGGDFTCYDNQLETLEGAPKSIGGNFFCYSNQLISLDGWPKVSGVFHCSNNPCYKIYEDWIDTDRRDELLDMMDDYDFLRGDVINWYLLEAFFEDAGLEIPNRIDLEEDYIIED
jgi:hypothetical protein